LGCTRRWGRSLTSTCCSDWKIYRIDFTRAFRQNKNLQDPKNLVRCDRMFENGKDLQQKTKRYLDKSEFQAVMARRYKIVDYSQNLAEEGQNEVLS